MTKLSPEMQKLMETPIEELMVRTRAKSNDFGALSDEEKALLHRKVAVNLKIAKAFKAGAEIAQFFIINDTPKEDAVSPKFKKGDVIQFVKTKDGITESHKLPILGFKQAGSRLKVSYKTEDGKELTFVPAGMSIDTKVGGVSLSKANIVSE